MILANFYDKNGDNAGDIIGAGNDAEELRYLRDSRGNITGSFRLPPGGLPYMVGQHNYQAAQQPAPAQVSTCAATTDSAHSFILYQVRLA